MTILRLEAHCSSLPDRYFAGWGSGGSPCWNNDPRKAKPVDCAATTVLQLEALQPRWKGRIREGIGVKHETSLKILKEIMAKLNDRYGFDSWWCNCDDEIQEEIRVELLEIIEKYI